MVSEWGLASIAQTGLDQDVLELKADQEFGVTSNDSLSILEQQLLSRGAELAPR